MLPRALILNTLFAVLINSLLAYQTAAQLQLNQLSGTSHVPDAWLEDCSLNDIKFLDAKKGWAVGDHGLALFTRDGGQRWHKISLDTRVNLQSIHFVDEQFGWIVGGFAVPYVDHTHGYIWRTRDGGANWEMVRHHALPWIKHIEFQTPQSGWCITIANHVNPTGFYRTNDGGLTWSHKIGDSRSQWIAADQVEGNKVLVGDRGTLGHGVSDKIEPGVFNDGVRRTLRAVCMMDRETGFAVGPHGQLMRTRDGGLSWFPIEPDLDPQQRELFDFRTVCVTGSSVWFAGNPGSVVFQFDVENKRWNRVVTNVNEPINKIEFFNPQRGWLVTSLGTIMTTFDGGNQWQVQRRSAQRIGMMTIAESADRLPLETISLYCGEDQWITSATIVDPKSSRFADSPWLAENAARPALTRLGLSYVVTLNQPPAKSNQQPVESNPQYILSRLVREIRSQRPTVVVVGGKPQIMQSPLDSLVAKAVQMAGDNRAFPEQLEKANLQVWHVDKLYRTTQQGNEDASVNHRRYLTTLGNSIEDHVLVSRGLLNLSAQAPPSTHLTQMYSHRPDGVREHQLFNETVISQLDQARRQNARRAAGSSITYSVVGRKGQSFDKLRKWTTGNSRMRSDWLTELSTAVNGLNSDISGCWLYQLADQYMRDGKPEMTARALTQLVKSNPNHPFTDASLLWLMNYFYSDEMAYTQAKEIEKQINQGQPMFDPNVQPAGFSSQPIQLSNQNGSVLIWTPPSQALDQDEDPRAILAPELMKELSLLEKVKRVHSLRMRQGHYVWQTLSNRSPHLPEVPAFKFSSITYKRKYEGSNVAAFLSKNLANGHWDRYGFAGAALVERWLNDRSTPIGRVPMLNCQMAKQRPFLDGVLDDEIWQSLGASNATQKLQSPKVWAQTETADKPTDLMLAFDEQYLYMAVRCVKTKGPRYPTTATSRERDMDLDQFDRITIQLDTDRDYATAYSLTIDSRGCVHDSCGRDPGWNPKWYVASTQDENTWFAEAAIPLTELVPDNSFLRQPWAISAKRVTPGDGHQVWPLASLDDSAISITYVGLPIKGDVRPKEFGLLQFQLPESEDDPSK